MPLPIMLLWGAAALLAGTGVVKGVGAMNDLDAAKEKGRLAEERYREGEEQLAALRDATNAAFVKLGKVKLKAFKKQISHLVEVLRKSKATRSRLQGFEVRVSVAELKDMERLVLASLEIERGLVAGATTGTLAALGAYGGAGMLATASTGAAISGLSGAAATNATLAWFGGGALGTGYGMAGGAIALGGIVLGPALAVGGFMLAAKAEQALTKAHAYEARVAVALADMERVGEVMQALQRNADELRGAITKMARRFDGASVDDSRNGPAFEAMVVLGKGLKGLLDVAIMDADGNAAEDVQARISGLLEL